MSSILKKIVELIKSKLGGVCKPCYAGAEILSAPNRNEKSGNINCFWMPNFDPPRPNKQTQSQLRVKSQEEKQSEKMKMILNNLQQKLNEELCGQIANVIDVMTETAEVIGKLSKIDTCIPLMQSKIKNLIEDCLEDCQLLKSNVLRNIRSYAIQIKARQPEEYADKIEKTIAYCVSNHDDYEKTDYCKYYGRKPQRYNSELSLDEILNLVK